MLIDWIYWLRPTPITESSRRTSDHLPRMPSLELSAIKYRESLWYTVKLPFDVAEEKMKST